MHSMCGLIAGIKTTNPLRVTNRKRKSHFDTAGHSTVPW